MKNFIASLFTNNSEFSLKKYYLLLYILGSGLMAAITIPFGPAIGGDSIDYISTAANLAAGNGFINYGGGIYITWPPLYPMILAAVSIITGFSAYTSGWIINSMLFGFFLVLAARLFQLSLPPKPIWSILASIALLLSFSAIAIFSSIAADPLFIILAILFLIQIQVFINKMSSSSVAYLGIIAAFASLQRWNGAVLIMLGAIMIFYTFRHNFKKALSLTSGFGLIAILPVSIWVLGHNYSATGSLYGRGTTPLRGNLINTTVDYIYPRLLHWFLPVSITRLIPEIIFVIALILVFLFVATRLGFANTLKELSHPAIYPLILFILIYLPFVALTTIIADHPNIFDDRYLVPILAPLLVLLFWMIDKLTIILSQKRLKNYGYYAVVIGFVLWSIYPINIIRKMVIYSFAHGPPAPNEFNVDKWRDSETIAFIQNYDFNPDFSIVSNYASALYLFTGKTVTRPPLDKDNHPALMENIVDSIEAWRGTSSSYLVWFIPNCCKDYYDPQQLSTEFTMTLLYSSEDGMLFLMEMIDQPAAP